jgi:hypothetical protein
VVRGGTISCGLSRRLLTTAEERLDEAGTTRLTGLLAAGDRTGDLRMTWHAKEMIRDICTHRDPELAHRHVERLGQDLQEDAPPEVASLGRTLNNLIERIKRIASGMTNFRNFRIRVLLHAGRPDWELLATVTPR